MIAILGQQYQRMMIAVPITRTHLPLTSKDIPREPVGRKDKDCGDDEEIDDEHDGNSDDEFCEVRDEDDVMVNQSTNLPVLTFDQATQPSSLGQRQSSTRLRRDRDQNQEQQRVPKDFCRGISYAMSGSELAHFLFDCAGCADLWILGGKMNASSTSPLKACISVCGSSGAAITIRGDGTVLFAHLKYITLRLTLSWLI